MTFGRKALQGTGWRRMTRVCVSSRRLVAVAQRGGASGAAVVVRAAGIPVPAGPSDCREPTWSRVAIRCGIYRAGIIGAVIVTGGSIGPIGAKSAIRTGSILAKSSGYPGRVGGDDKAAVIERNRSWIAAQEAWLTFHRTAGVAERALQHFSGLMLVGIEVRRLR